MATNWQIGDRIQNCWEIHNILTGGMGIVFIVYDHEHRATYAAKTFQDEVFARAQAVRGAALNAAQWSNKGLALDNLGRSEEALACFARAIEINPRDALAWCNKGAALGNSGCLHDALACFTEAQRLGFHRRRRRLHCVGRC